MSKNGDDKIETAESGDFSQFPGSNDIEKILELPDIDDMAGVLERANFKNDRQRLGAVRLAYRNRRFQDDNHQHMLRDLCASTIGMGGLGKVLQVFTATRMLAPDMMRVAFGMPKTKKTEEVHRSSDMRADTNKVKEEDHY